MVDLFLVLGIVGIQVLSREVFEYLEKQELVKDWVLRQNCSRLREEGILRKGIEEKKIKGRVIDCVEYG